MTDIEDRRALKDLADKLADCKNQLNLIEEKAKPTRNQEKEYKKNLLAMMQRHKLKRLIKVGRDKDFEIQFFSRPVAPKLDEEGLNHLMSEYLIHVGGASHASPDSFAKFFAAWKTRHGKRSEGIRVSRAAQKKKADEEGEEEEALPPLDLSDIGAE